MRIFCPRHLWAGDYLTDSLLCAGSSWPIPCLVQAAFAKPSKADLNRRVCSSHNVLNRFSVFGYSLFVSQIGLLQRHRLAVIAVHALVSLKK